MSEHQPTVLTCDDPTLQAALNYVLNNRGKGLRGQLARASCQLFTDAELPGVDTVATAIEWLHAYSLVHDDLPAMDNDDMRRGRPTVHRAFNEATAILVGDGLQAAAFQLIADDTSLGAEPRVRLSSLIAQAVGVGGMVGGQALDMAAENQPLGREAMARMHRQKTGALIRAAVIGGAICGGATDDDQARLAAFADAVGLAFQVTDDILDVTASSEALGKTAGKDLTAQKSTYVSLLGLEGAKAEARTLLDTALASLEHYGDRAQALGELATRMVLRDY